MENILCVQRLDKATKSQILLRIRLEEESNIDCYILGTDGDLAFDAQLTSSSLKQTRAPAFDGTDDAWEDLVHHILLGQQFTKGQVDMSRVEVSGQVTGSKLTLAIRRLLEGGITVRLGSIELKRNDALLDTIELFDWAALSANATCQVARQLEDLRAQHAERVSENNRFRAQMQEMVEAKQNHEHELLEKFRQLLNSKKMKIRHQQRHWNASTDHQSRKISEPGEDSSASRHQPVTFRMSKRKAAEQDVDFDADTQQGKEQNRCDQETPTPISSDDSNQEGTYGVPIKTRPSLPQTLRDMLDSPSQNESNSDRIEEDDEDDEL